MTLSPVLCLLPTVPWTLCGCREASPKTTPGESGARGPASSGQGIIPTPDRIPNDKARRGECRTGGERSEIYLMRYVRTPPSGLNDSTVCPAFFIAPAMNPRTVCFCHPIVCIISASVAPFLRRSMATTWAVLLPGRDAAVGTLKRWLRLPEFLVEYRRVRWEVAEQGYATGIFSHVCEYCEFD